MRSATNEAVKRMNDNGLVTFDLSSKVGGMVKDKGIHFISSDPNKQAIADYVEIVREYLIISMAPEPWSYKTNKDKLVETKGKDGKEIHWEPVYTPVNKGIYSASAAARPAPETFPEL
jgi:hypothetical protein